MKLNKLILILLLCLSCRTTSSTVHGDEMEFIIKDKSIIDESYISLLIRNKTTINYYLPIINSFESEKWRFMLTQKENVFFFLDKNIYDKYGNQLLWQTVNYEMEDPGLSELNDCWVKKRKNIRAKDFILLNSGDSVMIKLPINLVIKVSDNWVWSPDNFEKKDSLYIRLLYHEKYISHEVELLNKKTINELKKWGYKLYTDEIISNSVNLIPKHVYNFKDRLKEKIIKIDSLKDLKRSRSHIDIPKGSIQEKYFRYCTPNLKHLHRDKIYPFFPTEKLCSIEKCFLSLSFPEINLIIYRRLKEIARVNFKNKIYLQLVEGTGSVEFAEKQNENITDDSQLIYISVDDFIASKEILKSVEIYNTETRKLMAKIKQP